MFYEAIHLLLNGSKHDKDPNPKHLKNALINYLICERNFVPDLKNHRILSGSIKKFITNQKLILIEPISSISQDFLHLNFLCKLLNYHLMQSKSFLFSNLFSYAFFIKTITHLMKKILILIA